MLAGHEKKARYLHPSAEQTKQGPARLGGQNPVTREGSHEEQGRPFPLQWSSRVGMEGVLKEGKGHKDTNKSDETRPEGRVGRETLWVPLRLCFLRARDSRRRVFFLWIDHKKAERLIY